MAGLKFAFFVRVLLVHLIESSRGSGVDDQKLSYLLYFNWNNGTEWQEDLADTQSDAFTQTVKELKQKLDWLFDETPNVLSWDVIRLADNSDALKVSSHVQTPANVSAEELASGLSKAVQTQMKSEKKMVSDIVAEKLSLHTPSLTILPHSTMIQMSPHQTVMTSTQEISAVSTTPQIPTDKPKPTIPTDAVKFVALIKIENFDYIPAMADTKSTDFKKLAEEIKAVLNKELCLRKLPGCFGITVIKLEDGSVIVTSNIHMSSSTKYEESDVKRIISDSAKNNELGHLQVSNVEVNKEEKDSGLSAPSGIFVYLLYGAGAVLAIALIILAVFKYKSCKRQTQADRN